MLFRFPVLEGRGGDRGSCAGCFYYSVGEKNAFPIRSPFEEFLVFIRNSCLNYIRSTRSKDRYIASLAYEEQAENFEESIILTEIHRELAAAVEKLPEECRKVFQLCYFRGVDNESAAQELGLSVNTVKAQKARGKKILKENLKDIFPLLMLLNPLF